MRRWNYLWGAVLAALWLGGCFNLKVDEPLVDLGNGQSSSKPKAVQDPAPGVPNNQLTREQRLQRDLAQTQQMLKRAEEKNVRLEQKREEDKDEFKKDIKRLEEKIKDLEKENRKLRDDLHRYREKD
jgi:hypothetical protein